MLATSDMSKEDARLDAVRRTHKSVSELDSEICTPWLHRDCNYQVVAKRSRCIFAMGR